MLPPPPPPCPPCPRCPSVTLVDDLHWHTQRKRATQVKALRLSDAVLSTYAYNVRAFYPELKRTPIYWIPHAASPKFFMPLMEQPVYNKVLLSG